MGVNWWDVECHDSFVRAIWPTHRGQQWREWCLDWRRFLWCRALWLIFTHDMTHSQGTAVAGVAFVWASVMSVIYIYWQTFPLAGISVYSVCKCMYLYIYVHVVYVCACMYTYTSICMCIYIYIHVHICIYVHIYINMYSFEYIYIYVYIFVHIYMYIYIHKYLYISTLHHWLNMRFCCMLEPYFFDIVKLRGV